MADRCMRRMQKKKNPEKKKKNAFKIARAQLVQIQKNNDIVQLHTLFVQLFVHRLQLSTHHISAEEISTFLATAQFSDETVAQWQEFFSQLLQGTFYKNAYDEKAVAQLCKQAVQWLDKLEEKL